MRPPNGHNTLASCPMGTQGQWLSLAPSHTTPLPASSHGIGNGCTDIIRVKYLVFWGNFLL